MGKGERGREDQTLLYKLVLSIYSQAAAIFLCPHNSYMYHSLFKSICFQHFVKLCCNAFNVLRRHASQLITMLGLMLFANIPELQVG